MSLFQSCNASAQVAAKGKITDLKRIIIYYCQLKTRTAEASAVLALPRPLIKPKPARGFGKPWEEEKKKKGKDHGEGSDATDRA